MAYKIQQKTMIAKHVGNNAILFTTDGPTASYFIRGAIPDTLTTIDFGPTDQCKRRLSRDEYLSKLTWIYNLSL